MHNPYQVDYDLIANLPDIDYVDLHVYPYQNDYEKPEHFNQVYRLTERMFQRSIRHD